MEERDFPKVQVAGSSPVEAIMLIGFLPFAPAVLGPLGLLFMIFYVMDSLKNFTPSEPKYKPRNNKPRIERKEPYRIENNLVCYLNKALSRF